MLRGLYVTAALAAVTSIPMAAMAQPIDSVPSEKELAVKSALTMGASPEELEDLQRLAKDTGRPLRDIVRKHGNATERSKFLGFVETEFADSFSGAEVGEDGTLHLYFKGQKAEKHKGITSRATSSVPISMSFGRAITNAEWNDSVGPELSQQLQKAGIEIHSARYDYKSDTIETRVLSSAVNSARAAISNSSVKSIAGIRVNIITDDTLKGELETTVLGGSNLGVCTGAFAVKGGNHKGLVTAGHCPNYLKYGGENILTFRAEGLKTRGDMQWHSTAVTKPRFRATSSVYRTVAGNASIADGDPVCIFGAFSNGGCDELWSANQLISGNGYNFGAAAVTYHDRTVQGDSGGPWYWGNYAKGVHTGDWGTGNYATKTSRIGVVLPGVSIQVG